MSVCATPQMTVDQRRMVFRLRKSGLTAREVARAAGIHLMTVYRVLEGASRGMRVAPFDGR